MREDNKTLYYPPRMSIHRDEYPTRAEYQKAYRECARHYGYKARVTGGWMFFEFENDYRTWKNQR